MRVAVVIPARFSSTRLPGKPLSEIHGKTMIQRVYEKALLVKGGAYTATSYLATPYIATDDERIATVVRGFGGNVLMTSSVLRTGTDRVAEAAEKIEADVLVNLQGDEPLIEPSSIEKVIDLIVCGKFQMGTLMTRLKDPKDLLNPSVVKVLVDKNKRALSFSRLPLSGGFRHIGIYSFTRETLFHFRDLPPSDLEKKESLEQLRALENGISIGVDEVDTESVGVDTFEDLEKVRKIVSDQETRVYG